MPSSDEVAGRLSWGSSPGNPLEGSSGNRSAPGSQQNSASTRRIGNAPAHQEDFRPSLANDAARKKLSIQSHPRQSTARQQWPRASERAAVAGIEPSNEWERACRRVGDHETTCASARSETTWNGSCASWRSKRVLHVIAHKDDPTPLLSRGEQRVFSAIAEQYDTTVAKIRLAVGCSDDEAKETLRRLVRVGLVAENKKANGSRHYQTTKVGSLHPQLPSVCRARGSTTPAGSIGSRSRGSFASCRASTSTDYGGSGCAGRAASNHQCAFPVSQAKIPYLQRREGPSIAIFVN